MAKQGKMTANAKRFKSANEASPVVEGRVLHPSQGGGEYWLKDGKRFTLSAAECRAVGEPRWDL